MLILKKQKNIFKMTGCVSQSLRAHSLDAPAAQSRVFSDSAPTIVCVNSPAIDIATFQPTSVALQHIFMKRCLNTILTYIGTMHTLHQQANHLPAKDSSSFLRFWLKQ